MTTAIEATIAVTKQERDVLHHILELLLDSGDGIRLSDVETAVRHRQEFEDAFGILDHIGWDPQDPRDTFELPVDEALRRFLQREHDSLSQHVAHEALLCKRVRERADGILGPGESSEAAWKEWEIESERSLNTALEELHVLDRMSDYVRSKAHA